MLLEATACRRFVLSFSLASVNRTWYHDYVFIGWLNYYDSRSLLPKLEASKIQCMQIVSVNFKEASTLNPNFSIIRALNVMLYSKREVEPKTVILIIPDRGSKRIFNVTSKLKTTTEIP